jgi:glycosyltransferase involved in cell wall biosynthesis
MGISVIIPTHNRKDLLRRCLAAATSQDYPDYEVIVVDDGSTDGTGAMVRREFPQVRYIRQERNRGPAAARNRGIKVATGEIIAFTDDDCLLPLDFLSRLADGYRRYPEVAGVGGYLEAPDDLLRTNPFARYEAYVTHQVDRAGPEE